MLVSVMVTVVIVQASFAFAEDAGPNCFVPDCAPKWDCSHQSDNRECSSCLISLFGRCIQHGNDPACEAAKAAQNKIFALQQAECEQQKAKVTAECNQITAKWATVCAERR
jgi:hypothetical protein